jgi:hypothetical protein
MLAPGDCPATVPSTGPRHGKSPISLSPGKLVRETWHERGAHGVLRAHSKPILIDRRGIKVAGYCGLPGPVAALRAHDAIHRLLDRWRRAALDKCRAATQVERANCASPEESGTEDSNDEVSPSWRTRRPPRMARELRTVQHL